MAQIVPLTSAPNQQVSIAPSVNGASVPLQLKIRRNIMAALWIMSVLDKAGNLLVDSVPLIPGVYPAANVLMPYQYLNIGSAYVVNASGIAQEYPSSSNLGTDYVLVWDDQA